MAETPRYAHLVAVVFLGSAFVVLLCVLLAVVAAVGKAKRVAKLAAGGAALTALGYAILLFGVALASSNKNLPPGGWKYFCEADCHIAYAIQSVEEASTVGPEAKPISAKGHFIIVRLKTWFDQNSIAPFRGNSPLTPDRRTVKLVDDGGRYYLPDPAAAAFFGAESTPITEPLRPGESYVTTLVFDLPAASHEAKLLIVDIEPLAVLLVDHENSLLHGKIYLSLRPDPRIAASPTQ